MRIAAEPPPHDPEFDRTTPDLPAPTERVVKYYQRLVVNPFPGLLWLIGLLIFFYSSDLTWKWFMNTPYTVLLFPYTFLFIQYHCLDCGVSGMFIRRKLHVCGRIRERWVRGRMVSVYFPNPPLQLILWSIAILDVVLFVLRSRAG